MLYPDGWNSLNIFYRLIIWIEQVHSGFVLFLGYKSFFNGVVGKNSRD